MYLIKLVGGRPPCLLIICQLADSLFKKTAMRKNSLFKQARRPVPTGWNPLVIREKETNAINSKSRMGFL